MALVRKEAGKDRAKSAEVCCHLCKMAAGLCYPQKTGGGQARLEGLEWG